MQQQQQQQQDPDQQGAQAVFPLLDLPDHVVAWIVHEFIGMDRGQPAPQQLWPQLLASCKQLRDAVRAQATGMRIEVWRRSGDPSPAELLAPLLSASALPPVHKLWMQVRDDAGFGAVSTALAARPDVIQRIASMCIVGPDLNGAPEALSLLPQLLPQLRSLTLRGVDLMQSHLSCIGVLPRLKALRFVSCFIFEASEPADVAALAALAGSLTSLEFDCIAMRQDDDRCVEIDYRPLALAHGGLPSLQQLQVTVPTAALLGPSLQGTPLASGLRKLELTTHPGYEFTGSNFGALTALTQLTHLVLRTGEYPEYADGWWRPEPFPADLLSSCLAALRSLRVLDLSCMVELEGAVQQGVAAAGPAAVAAAPAPLLPPPSPLPVPAAAAAAAVPSLQPNLTRLICREGLLSPTWARLPLASVQRITTRRFPGLSGGKGDDDGDDDADPVAVILHAYSSVTNCFATSELEEAARKLAACPVARALSKVIIAGCHPGEEDACGEGVPVGGGGGAAAMVAARFEEWRAAVRPLCAELCPHGVRVILNTRLLGADGEYVVGPETGKCLRDVAGSSYVQWWPRLKR